MVQGNDDARQYDTVQHEVLVAFSELHLEMVEYTDPPAPNSDAYQKVEVDLNVEGLLTRRQRAVVHQVLSFSLQIFIRPMQWRSRQRHQTCSCRLEDTKGRDELHERVDSGWLR